METVTPAAALRPRDYVAVRGPDAADFLDRMLSNEVAKAPCEALLLTPKARVIAPMTVVRRGEDDFLLLTEPGLGPALQGALIRARFAAKVEIEAEEHTSLVVFGERDGIPNNDYGVPAVELLDADPPSETADDEDLADAFAHGWFSDDAAFLQVALWGLALAAIGIGSWLLSRRFRRNWVGALVGIVPFALVLYFFFQNVNRLLPAAL